MPLCCGSGDFSRPPFLLGAHLLASRLPGQGTVTAARVSGDVGGLLTSGAEMNNRERG